MHKILTLLLLIQVQFCSTIFNNVYIETKIGNSSSIQLALDAGCKTIHSIENSQSLFLSAYDTYKPYKNVHLFLGNSQTILKPLTLSIKETFTIFFKNPSMLLNELEIVFSHPIKNHTLIFYKIDPLIEEKIKRNNQTYNIKCINTKTQGKLFIAYCN